MKKKGDKTNNKSKAPVDCKQSKNAGYYKAGKYSKDFTGSSAISPTPQRYEHENRRLSEYPNDDADYMTFLRKREIQKSNLPENSDLSNYEIFDDYIMSLRKREKQRSFRTFLKPSARSRSEPHLAKASLFHTPKPSESAFLSLMRNCSEQINNNRALSNPSLLQKEKADVKKTPSSITGSLKNLHRIHCNTNRDIPDGYFESLKKRDQNRPSSQLSFSNNSLDNMRDDYIASLRKRENRQSATPSPLYNSSYENVFIDETSSLSHDLTLPEANSYSQQYGNNLKSLRNSGRERNLPVSREALFVLSGAISPIREEKSTIPDNKNEFKNTAGNSLRESNSPTDESVKADSELTYNDYVILMSTPKEHGKQDGIQNYETQQRLPSEDSAYLSERDEPPSVNDFEEFQRYLTGDENSDIYDKSETCSVSPAFSDESEINVTAEIKEVSPRTDDVLTASDAGFNQHQTSLTRHQDVDSLNNKDTCLENADWDIIPSFSEETITSVNVDEVESSMSDSYYESLQKREASLNLKDTHKTTDQKLYRSPLPRDKKSSPVRSELHCDSGYEEYLFDDETNQTGENKQAYLKASITIEDSKTIDGSEIQNTAMNALKTQSQNEINIMADKEVTCEKGNNDDDMTPTIAPPAYYVIMKHQDKESETNDDRAAESEDTKSSNTVLSHKNNKLESISEGFELDLTPRRTFNFSLSRFSSIFSGMNVISDLQIDVKNRPVPRQKTPEYVLEDLYKRMKEAEGDSVSKTNSKENAPASDDNVRTSDTDRGQCQKSLNCQQNSSQLGKSAHQKQEKENTASQNNGRTTDHSPLTINELNTITPQAEPYSYYRSSMILDKLNEGDVHSSVIKIEKEKRVAVFYDIRKPQNNNNNNNNINNKVTNKIQAFEKKLATNKFAGQIQPNSVAVKYFYD